MTIETRLQDFKHKLPVSVTLVAVSKTHPAEAVAEAYKAGHRVFGENRVQELVPKATQLPADIKWHLIGHLQSNKVKYIAPFIHLIHSVDSLSLLQEINKQAQKNKRIINCLLQVYIATEETKFGLSLEEVEELMRSEALNQLEHIRIIGLMGMASNTSDDNLIRKEFSSLKQLYDKINALQLPKISLKVLSMGMSGDYKIAIEEGSNMIRIGSSIFGNRDYPL